MTRRVGTRDGPRPDEPGLDEPGLDDPGESTPARSDHAAIPATVDGAAAGTDGAAAQDGLADDRVPDALAPGLYIVATPIGNLRDLTFRARDVLQRADAILCEDTRVTAKLCHAYGIDRPLRPYHDHNAARVRPAILERLAAGAALALVSDAGTPLIADPGYRLVREARAAGIAVVPIPGAASPIAALSAAGLPTDRFLFGGFLGQKTEQRRRALREVAALPASLVFLTGAARLPAVLADMVAELGADREAVVAREITKRFETFDSRPLGELAAAYGESGPPRGEVVVLVAPPDPAAAMASEDDLDAALLAALAGSSVRSAADEVSRALGLKRRRVYARALELRDRAGPASAGGPGGDDDGD